MRNPYSPPLAMAPLPPSSHTNLSSADEAVPPWVPPPRPLWRDDQGTRQLPGISSAHPADSQRSPTRDGYLYGGWKPPSQAVAHPPSAPHKSNLYNAYTSPYSQSASSTVGETSGSAFTVPHINGGSLQIAPEAHRSLSAASTNSSVGTARSTSHPQTSAASHPVYVPYGSTSTGASPSEGAPPGDDGAQPVQSIAPNQDRRPRRGRGIARGATDHPKASPRVVDLSEELEPQSTQSRSSRKSDSTPASSTALQLDGAVSVPAINRQKTPRKRSSREDSGGLRIDYLAVQQTYSKLLSSIPSMFESEPAESTNGDDEPRISLQNLKALTDMAVFGHSLCTATAAIQATDSPQLCTSGRLPVMSPEAMSTVDENDLRTRNDDFDGGNGNDMPQRDASVAEPPAQACLGCGAKDTPEWRRGPLGPRTLCNACGLVFAKLVRKRAKNAKAAAGSTAGGPNGTAPAPKANGKNATGKSVTAKNKKSAK